MNKRRNGITLVELIVVAFILLILMYCIYNLLAPGMKVWMKSDTKVKLQQSSLVGMYRLINELKESNIHTVTLINYDMDVYKIDTLISFASARDEDGTFVTKEVQYGSNPTFDSKQPEWQKYIIYYRDFNLRLRRCETPNYESYRESDSMRISLDPALVIDINNSQTNKIVTPQIAELKISYYPDENDWKGALLIKLSAFNQDPSPEYQFRTTLETMIGVRYNEKD